MKHKCWQIATNEKLQALQDNQTCDHVPFLSKVKLVSCKWIYTINLNSNESLDIYKACLVTFGYRQEHGIDYDEAFASIANMTTIQIILMLVDAKSRPIF